MSEQWTDDDIMIEASSIADAAGHIRLLAAESLLRRMRAEMQAEIDRLTNVGLDAAYGEAINAGALDDTTRAYHGLLDRIGELVNQNRELTAENRRFRDVLAAKTLLFDSEIDDLLAQPEVEI